MHRPMKSPNHRWLVPCIAVTPLTIVFSAACATEPELNDDFATYEVSSAPIPLTPIPGADITEWAEAIDPLDLGEWTSSGSLITDAYEPARSEPVEDPRIEADRLSWATDGLLPHGDTTFAFNARAVTDTDQGVLSISCDADYDVYAEDLGGGLTSLPFEEVRRALRACVSGSGNDAIDSAELTTWLDEQMDAAQAAYEADEGRDRFQVSDFIDAANVLIWFGSNEHGAFVSLHVDPRAEARPS